MSDNMKKLIVPKGSIKKIDVTHVQTKDPGRQIRKPLAPSSVAPGRSIEGELVKLREVAAVVQEIRLSAQHELEMIRKMRAEAQRYRQETETKARSQAQQLILRTRLATQREVEELIRNASAEIQKVLADIRVIRITAQEELGAQRKFTDAARLYSLSLALQEKAGKPEGKRRKQLAYNK